MATNIFKKYFEPLKKTQFLKFCEMIIKLYSFVSAFIIDLCWEEKWIFSMDMFC